MTNKFGIYGSAIHSRGIFGGTFSPFTVAHRAIVKGFIDNYSLDELYIIPTIVNCNRAEDAAACLVDCSPDDWRVDDACRPSPRGRRRVLRSVGLLTICSSRSALPTSLNDFSEYIVSFLSSLVNPARFLCRTKDSASSSGAIIVNYHRKGKEETLLEPQKVEIIERLVDTLPPFYRRRIFIDKSEFAYRDLCRDLSEEAWESLVNGRRFLHTLLDFNVRHGIDKYVSRPFVCIGTDSFEHLDEWYMNTEIVKICNLVVVQGREDKIIESPITHTEFRISSEYENVSATKIREKMRCRNWSHYIEDVQRLDEGKTTLAELGWI